MKMLSKIIIIANKTKVVPEFRVLQHAWAQTYDVRARVVILSGFTLFQKNDCRNARDTLGVSRA